MDVAASDDERPNFSEQRRSDVCSMPFGQNRKKIEARPNVRVDVTNFSRTRGGLLKVFDGAVSRSLFQKHLADYPLAQTGVVLTRLLCGQEGLGLSASLIDAPDHQQKVCAEAIRRLSVGRP